MEIKKMAEEWEIWEKEEVAKSEKEIKKLVPKHFHKYIHVFGKKQSERIPIRKPWDYTIEIRKGFVPRKGKIYLLFKKEREEMQDVMMCLDTNIFSFSFIYFSGFYISF